MLKNINCVSDLNQGLNKSTNSLIKDSLKKTTMCDFYRQGKCNRGDGCVYAHSETELRPKPDLYKTQLCRAWQKKGSCERGEKCTFAHGESEIRRTDGKDRNAYYTEGSPQSAKTFNSDTRPVKMGVVPSFPAKYTTVCFSARLNNSILSDVSDNSEHLTSDILGPFTPKRSETHIREHQLLESTPEAKYVFINDEELTTHLSSDDTNSLCFDELSAIGWERNTLGSPSVNDQDVSNSKDVPESWLSLRRLIHAPENSDINTNRESPRVGVVPNLKSSIGFSKKFAGSDDDDGSSAEALVISTVRSLIQTVLSDE